MPKTTKPRATKTKRALASKESEKYIAGIKIFGRVHTAEGETALEAVSKLSPGKVAKGASVLTVTHGGKSHSKILNGRQTAGLFALSRTMREIALKNVSLMFQGL